jgi:hypothetical protein
MRGLRLGGRGPIVGRGRRERGRTERRHEIVSGVRVMVVNRQSTPTGPNQGRKAGEVDGGARERARKRVRGICVVMKQEEARGSCAARMRSRASAW